MVRCEALEVACTVRDVKESYGRPRLLVRPEAGTGEQWVELGRVRIEVSAPGTLAVCCG